MAQDLKRLIAVAGSVLVFGLAAPATATTILPNSNGEPSLATSGGVLDTLYGLGNLTRASDAGDGVWQYLGNASATVKGKYAGYSEVFGFIPGTGGGSFVPLFTVTGNGLLSGPSASLALALTGHDFRFAIDPNGSSAAPGVWSSLESDNGDGLDHMVTFRITGNDGHPENEIGAWVIAFEDLPLGSSDRDYNDLIIEVRGVADAVPAPATALLLAGGLAALAALGWRRRP